MDEPPTWFDETTSDLPHNIEVEQALLGAILVNNEAALHVTDFLEPEHFHEPAHGGDYLRRLANGVIKIINAKDYGRIVHDLAVRRELIRISLEIIPHRALVARLKAGLEVVEGKPARDALQKLIGFLDGETRASSRS